MRIPVMPATHHLLYQVFNNFLPKLPLIKIKYTIANHLGTCAQRVSRFLLVCFAVSPSNDLAEDGSVASAGDVCLL